MRDLLNLFPKPSHYAGLETGSVHKNLEDVSLHIALAFPDAYEVGMSYLGQKILYSIANANPAWWAERVMAPSREAAAILKERNAPLASLESDTPLNRLDAVCFSITHELCFTDVLHILDLGQIPLRSAQRPDDLHKAPLIIAGGGALLGAEPLMPFIDLAALGDGEEIFPELLSLLEKIKSGSGSRRDFLEQARHIPGAYVPAFFQEGENGALFPIYKDYRPRRRIVADLDKAPYPASQVIPIGAVHNRLAIEIARGCGRGCRFCHAGMTYRPVRERSVEGIQYILDKALNETGFEEISFLSLSTGDYSALKTIFNNAYKRCAKEQISLSLPSLRVGSVDDEIMQKIAELRRTGCTLAPEAGSQRLRDVINKGITEEELILHLRKLLEFGWRQVKLYFMIGLPTETDKDLEAIVDLCAKAREAGGAGAPRLQVTAGISPFVPKPFTPFQWEAQIDRAEMNRRISFLLNLFKKRKGLTMRWHDPDASYLEGLLSRADRKMADVVEKAYAKGAIFCGWAEFFSLEPWLAAMAECGIEPDELLKARNIQAPLPWDHLEGGISKDFLLKERKRAYMEKITPDCRYGACGNCGACDLPARQSLLAKSSGSTQKIQQRLVYKERDQNSSQPRMDENGVIIAQEARKNRPKLNPLITNKAAQYRIWHKKLGAWAYLSQLELQAVLERALRRAGIPVAFSSGFHPLPLHTFGRALPVGVTSEMEWFAVTLYAWLSPQNLKNSLNNILHEDLQVVLVENIDAANRTRQASIEKFSLLFRDASIFEAAAAHLQKFAAASQFMYDRKTKKRTETIDLRSMLQDWSMKHNPDGSGTLNLVIDWSGKYFSPPLLLNAIFNPLQLASGEHFLISKTAQIFPDGTAYEMPEKQL